jgi:hypothetical protein
MSHKHVIGTWTFEIEPHTEWANGYRASGSCRICEAYTSFSCHQGQLDAALSGSVRACDCTIVGDGTANWFWPHLMREGKE